LVLLELNSCAASIVERAIFGRVDANETRYHSRLVRQARIQGKMEHHLRLAALALCPAPSVASWVHPVARRAGFSVELGQASAVVRSVRFDAALLLLSAALGCGDDRDEPPLGAGLASGVAGTSGAAGANGSAGEGGSSGANAAGSGGGTGAVAGIAWDDAAGAEPGDVLGQRMLVRLRELCAGCHDEPTPVGLGSLASVAPLIEQGWVVPGESPASRLVEILREGHPPALGVTVPPATPGDAELLARFVDGLRVEAPACSELPFVSLDETFAALAADVAVLPADTRPFTRYLGLTYASNAGLCGAALDRQRLALFEAVNAVSLGEAIVLPQSIDARGLLYRIDIRDYRWDRAIDLLDDGSSPLADGWLAIAEAAAPYAAEYRGTDADLVNTETRTSVPFLAANAFVHAVAGGDLYYALVGVGRDTEAHRLGLGVVAELAYVGPAPGVSWAGLYDDGSRREMIIVRAAQARPERAYWLGAQQFTEDSESIFDTPFDNEPSGQSQVLFGLPNGMLGFLIENPDWTRATSGVDHYGCDDCERPATGVAGCSACHASGHAALRDDITGFVERNTEYFDRATLDDIASSYPTTAELAELVRVDNVAPLAALERLGLLPSQRDPLSRVYHQFESDRLTPRRAAAELGVSLITLNVAIATLEPLSGLRDGGTLDRAAFSAAYPAAACQLHATALQRPASCP
jgi:hypothetical protein